MPLTPAQLDTLRDMARHKGRATRVGNVRTAEWTWNVGGKPRSGTIDRLLRGGYLRALSCDTLELSDKGWSALNECSAADRNLAKAVPRFAPKAAPAAVLAI
jgi:hypothetical protein